MSKEISLISVLYLLAGAANLAGTINVPWVIYFLPIIGPAIVFCMFFFLYIFIKMLL